jgi:hypothetical protein
MGVEGREIERIDEVMHGVGEAARHELGIEIDRQQPGTEVDVLVSRHARIPCCDDRIAAGWGGFFYSFVRFHLEASVSPTNSTRRVIDRATQLVEQTANGVRYSELHRTISTEMPEIPPNTIYGALHKFRSEPPSGIYLPTRGLYRHVK